MIFRIILRNMYDENNLSCFYFFLQIEMSRLYTIIILACCILGAIAQKPARIGPDGKPLLNRPDLELCKKSKYFTPNTRRTKPVNLTMMGLSYGYKLIVFF